MIAQAPRTLAKRFVDVKPIAVWIPSFNMSNPSAKKVAETRGCKTEVAQMGGQRQPQKRYLTVAAAFYRLAPLMDSNSLALILTPHGRLTLGPVVEGPALEPTLARRLEDAFVRGSGHGLLQLGAGEVGTALPPVFSYWRELGSRYVTALCTLPDAATNPSKARIPSPPLGELEPLALASPAMTGAEYLTAEILRALWQEMDEAFATELAESGCSIQEFLKRRNPAWNLVGRVHFNLAENRKADQAPFAFLATYTTRLSAHAKAQHVPLGQALREYAGAENRDRLLSLLLPVQRSA